MEAHRDGKEGRKYNKQTPSFLFLPLKKQFIQWQKQLGWKRSLGSSSPTYDWAPPCQLDHGTKHYTKSLLKYL